MDRSKKCDKLPATCLFCGKILSNNACLQLHIATHTQERPYNCQYCDASFGSIVTKTTHVNNLHLGIKYKCGECRKIFTCSSNYYQHKRKCRCTSKMIIKRGHTFGKNGNNGVTGRKITPIRKKPGSNTVQEEVHVESAEIRLADKSIASKVVTHENEADSSNVSSCVPKNIPCEQASVDSDLCRLNNFNRRVNILLEEKRQLARKWDTGFFLHLNRYKPEDSCFSASFHTSIVATTTSKTVVMEVSNKQPIQPKISTLGKQQENKWTSQRLRSDKTTSRSLTVKKNVLVKSTTQKSAGRATYKCLACNKIFNTIAKLKRHEKYHEAYRPFKCNFCPSTFHEKTNAARHIATQHQYPEMPNRPINQSNARCGFCGKRFPRGISQLHSHITASHHDLLFVDSPAAVVTKAKD